MVQGSIFLVCALCLCVLSQMLGVPVTLLDAAGTSDHLAGSVLEGFSILPAIPQLLVSTVFIFLINARVFVHAPAFATAVFHPPVS